MSLPIAEDPGSAPTRSALTAEIKERLDALVQENDLVLFMKGAPEEPRCGFSQRAAEVYKTLERPFVAVDVLSEPDAAVFAQALAEWADWPTLPQCWVKGQLVGGSDIALTMLQSGELQEMLEGEATSPAQ